MGILVRVPFDSFKEVEQRLKYRFWDKERERSNRAALMAARGALATRCVRRHDTIGWVGPPHDKIRAYICLQCHAAASELEIKYKGFEFDTISLEEIHKIFDDDLARQARGGITSYPFRGRAR